MTNTPTDREHCCKCDQPTGRAGKDDDSLYHDDGTGPYCEECFDHIPDAKKLIHRATEATSDHVAEPNNMIADLLGKHPTPWTATRDFYLSMYGAIIDADGNVVIYGLPRPANQRRANMIISHLEVICHLANTYAVRLDAGEQLVEAVQKALEQAERVGSVHIDFVGLQAALATFKTVM